MPAFLQIANKSTFLQVYHEAGTPLVFPEVTASDDVEGSLGVVRSGVVLIRPDQTPANFTLVYTATDMSGLSVCPMCSASAVPCCCSPPCLCQTSLEIVVVVNDTLPPSIAFGDLDDASVVLEAGSSEAPVQPSAVDVNDGPVAVVADTTVNFLPDQLPATTVVTYVATDKAGLSASVQQTVRVVDTTPPTLALDGLKDVFLEAKDPYVEPGFKCLDVRDGDCNANVIVTISKLTPLGQSSAASTVNSDVPADTQYTLTYQVKNTRCLHLDLCSRYHSICCLYLTCCCGPGVGQLWQCRHPSNPDCSH
jgi:hypothetical protein